MTVPGVKGRQEKSGLPGDIPDAVPFPVSRSALNIGSALLLLGQAEAHKWKVLGNAEFMDGYQTLVHSGISAKLQAVLV